MSSLRHFDDALAWLLERATPLRMVETVSTLDAIGRVLAEDQVSGVDVPPMDNSQMDGYAVRCADVTPGARLRIAQRIAAGSTGRPLNQARSHESSPARRFRRAPMPS